MWEGCGQRLLPRQHLHSKDNQVLGESRNFNKPRQQKVFLKVQQKRPDMSPYQGCDDLTCLMFPCSNCSLYVMHHQWVYISGILIPIWQRRQRGLRDSCTVTRVERTADPSVSSFKAWGVNLHDTPSLPLPATAQCQTAWSTLQPARRPLRVWNASETTCCDISSSSIKSTWLIFVLSPWPW